MVRLRTHRRTERREVRGVFTNIVRAKKDGARYIVWGEK